jgi:tRNA U34 5-carboxymethylaminomethyl modifying GTPase MnmE/TrmE
MNTAGSPQAAGVPFSPALRVEGLRSQVREETVAHGSQDLTQVLDSIPGLDPNAPVRVIVAGSLKRGKSTLVNTLVGRPLLTPVGVDVTTSCWVEIGYGDDHAVALLADADAPGQPTRRPIALAEVERYASLRLVSEPVLGVEVRIRSDLLKDLVLVDTPGVGGLGAGHLRATLTALGQADALLFVSDSTQPILAPEVDFLAKATERVATVIIAVTKSDTPGYEVVLRETRDRLARHPGLAAIPIFAVSAPLADQAQAIEDAGMSAELAELSGVSPLAEVLRERATSGRHSMRIANCAQTTASVARTLAGRLAVKATDLIGEQSRAAELDKKEARLAAAIEDRARLSLLIHQHLGRLRVQLGHAFDASVSELGRKYREESERGPAAQLATLAARMAADLTAAGVATIEQAAERSRQLMGEILDQVGADEIAADIPLPPSSAFELSLRQPERGKSPASLGPACGPSAMETLRPQWHAGPPSSG